MSERTSTNVQAPPPREAAKAEAAPAVDDQHPEEPSAAAEAWHDVVRSSPSWLTSLMLHMAAVILLALWSMPDLPELTKNLLLSEPSNAEEDLDDFEEIDIQPVELETKPVEFEVQPETEVLAEEVSFSTFDDLTEAASFTELSDLGLTAAAPSSPTDALGFNGSGTSGRGRMSRTAIARAGGNKQSEEAIANALKWLATHQNPDGSWSLVHTGNRCQGRCPNPGRPPSRNSLRAGTGLALLPFLGAGQTHKQGRYKQVVERGLIALANLAKSEKQGASWRDPGGAGAYSHGISAIALTEAYGMTGDSTVGSAAQAAVDYIVYNQAADGGWRYSFQAASDTPPGIGDTSVVGWQIMALKSAHLAELRVPPATVTGASKFLDSVARDGGAQYVYVPGNNAVSSTRSSIGLLCRMYLGWKKDNKALQRGIARLAKTGPSKNNFYYNYYAAQVLFQFTGGRGAVWREWNTKLRDQLIGQQESKGHAKGSWFEEGAHNDRGGRLYMTSLATMTLEVYYRYMPIYQTEAVDNEFPE